jgi:hypothetical protein
VLIKFTLNSSADVGYKWSNGASTRSITINQAGLYTVQTINGFKCLSKPNPIEAKVNALPAPTSIFAMETPYSVLVIVFKLIQ